MSLPNVPGAMFIPEATSIPEPRVHREVPDWSRILKDYDSSLDPGTIPN